ncbi:hypothetical protein LRS12_02245 [Sphingomonas sp. J344]|uniref:hypothetical protein n=1 Tax=Sphingomonas sp. J344 TaxID=2898434 RepID=UPI002151EA27|nr:hypothetical protein [Sphingomonas sp. J344]MCR5869682.1 hypothetical protein [Sphingomonas sp. J344]
MKLYDSFTAREERAMHRRAILAGGTALAVWPTRIAATGIDIAAIDRRRILRAANRYLTDAPVTITAFRAERSPGTRHDYYSEGDYWWPNPADPEGPMSAGTAIPTRRGSMRIVRR